MPITRIDARRASAPSEHPSRPHTRTARWLRAGALALSLVLAACASSPPPIKSGVVPNGTPGTATDIATAPSSSDRDGAANPALPSSPLVPPGAQVTPRQIRIGLALGGGAARGFAHIGVIKALEAHGIHPDLVAGTSAGSVVAALYASGMNGLQMNKAALKLDEASISDWAMPFRSRGLIKGVALENYLNTTLNNRPIEQLKVPLGIVATDLRTGEPILFQRGNTGQAVRASCSIPSIFEPVKIGGHEYVDGGLVSPVPAAFAHKMGADFVIAVDISSRPESAVTSSSFDLLMQTFTIMGQSIKAYELDKYADVVIRPNLSKMGGADFADRNAAILAGEEAVDAAWPDIQRKLAAARKAPADLTSAR
ncbi:NTE family protein [Pararobbsia alpina]|uniref:patatin-like phospholipase family protein n=1 Tax=Pararobbsia alpina TaxID=621374 RepID=UPI0039A49F62